jgi:hypothetical protein
MDHFHITTVKLLIDYLYKGVYDVSEPGAAWTPDLQAKVESQTRANQESNSAALAHARLWEAADFYGIDHLQKYSETLFGYVMEGETQFEGFSDVMEFVFSLEVSGHERLCTRVAEILATNFNNWTQENSFRDLFTNAKAFFYTAQALNNMLLTEKEETAAKKKIISSARGLMGNINQTARCTNYKCSHGYTTFAYWIEMSEENFVLQCRICRSNIR